MKKVYIIAIIVVLVVLLIAFFYPKSCGQREGFVFEYQIDNINCNCIGIKAASINYASTILCYGICLKSSCKTTSPQDISPPNNRTFEVENMTIIPVPTPANVSLSGNLKLSIKAYNPQYKVGQDIGIKYTLENSENKTITIPKNIANGIEIKDSSGKQLEYKGSGEGLKLIKEPVTLAPNQKITSDIAIGGNDYDLTQLNNNEAYYTLTAYIGEIESNRVILRIIK